MADVMTTLDERAGLYGDISYAERAKTAQDIKEALRAAPGWNLLDAVQKETLEMIAHKQARIVAGAPAHADNWHDIAGYAKLGEDYISQIANALAVKPVAPTVAPAIVPAPVVVAPAPVEAAIPAPPRAPAPLVPTVPSTPPRPKVPDVPPNNEAGK